MATCDEIDRSRLGGVTGGAAQLEGMTGNPEAERQLFGQCLPAADAAHADVRDPAAREALRNADRQKCWGAYLDKFWTERKGGDNPKYYKGPQYW
jgi:hypothetical protein